MLKKEEKEYYLNKPTMAYWSEYGGLEVKELQYGYFDYLIVISNSFTSNKKVHRLMVRYVEKGAYVVLNGHKYWLNECLRSGL